MENYYEVYHNEEYGVPYYYNPYTRERKWELPEGVQAVDMRSEEEKKAYEDTKRRKQQMQEEEEEEEAKEDIESHLALIKEDELRKE